MPAPEACSPPQPYLGVRPDPAALPEPWAPLRLSSSLCCFSAAIKVAPWVRCRRRRAARAQGRAALHEPLQKSFDIGISVRRGGFVRCFSSIPVKHACRIGRAPACFLAVLLFLTHPADWETW